MMKCVSQHCHNNIYINTLNVSLAYIHKKHAQILDESLVSTRAQNNVSPSSPHCLPAIYHNALYKYNMLSLTLFPCFSIVQKYWANPILLCNHKIKKLNYLNKLTMNFEGFKSFPNYFLFFTRSFVM